MAASTEQGDRFDKYFAELLKYSSDRDEVVVASANFTFSGGTVTDEKVIGLATLERFNAHVLRAASLMEDQTERQAFINAYKNFLNQRSVVGKVEDIRGDHPDFHVTEDGWMQFDSKYQTPYEKGDNAPLVRDSIAYAVKKEVEDYELSDSSMPDREQYFENLYTFFADTDPLHVGFNDGIWEDEKLSIDEANALWERFQFDLKALSFADRKKYLEEAKTFFSSKGYWMQSDLSSDWHGRSATGTPLADGKIAIIKQAREQLIAQINEALGINDEQEEQATVEQAKQAEIRAAQTALAAANAAYDAAKAEAEATDNPPNYDFGKEQAAAAAKKAALEAQERLLGLEIELLELKGKDTTKKEAELTEVKGEITKAETWEANVDDVIDAIKARKTVSDEGARAKADADLSAAQDALQVSRDEVGYDVDRQDLSALFLPAPSGSIAAKNSGPSPGTSPSPSPRTAPPLKADSVAVMAQVAIHALAFSSGKTEYAAKMRTHTKGGGQIEGITKIDGYAWDLTHDNLGAFIPGYEQYDNDFNPGNQHDTLINTRFNEFLDVVMQDETLREDFRQSLLKFQKGGNQYENLSDRTAYVNAIFAHINVSYGVDFKDGIDDVEVATLTERFKKTSQAAAPAAVVSTPGEPDSKEQVEGKKDTSSDFVEVTQYQRNQAIEMFEYLTEILPKFPAVGEDKAWSPDPAIGMAFKLSDGRYFTLKHDETGALVSTVVDEDDDDLDDMIANTPEGVRGFKDLLAKHEKATLDPAASDSSVDMANRVSNGTDGRFSEGDNLVFIMSVYGIAIDSEYDPYNNYQYDKANRQLTYRDNVKVAQDVYDSCLRTDFEAQSTMSCDDARDHVEKARNAEVPGLSQ